MSNHRSAVDVSRTSRRDFIKRSSLLMAGGAVGTSLAAARTAHAYGSDLIRIGLIGCGHRGTAAAIQARHTTGGGVCLTALADAFADRVQSAYRALKGRHGDKVDVPRDRQFVGLQAYRELFESPLDLVLLAGPPGFRPLHFQAAIHAGKHVFMEKPVAVDAPGVQQILVLSGEARQRGLAVAVGLQRRHDAAYRETIAKLQDNAIGDIRLMQVCWNGGGASSRGRQRQHSELEHQLRNWYHFAWLSGDPLVETHVHHLDVINWLKRGYPVSAQVQPGPVAGERAEAMRASGHACIEYRYEDGSKLVSHSRRLPGYWHNVSEHASGTRGQADISGGRIFDSAGKLVWQTRAERNGHQQELSDLLAALRRGELVAEGESAACSTMTAILGRIAAHSGQSVRWEDALLAPVSLGAVQQLQSLRDQPPA